MEPANAVYDALFRDTKALSTALGCRDSLTQLHSERVLGLATKIGELWELSDFEMGILKISATFHDVGKIGIPDQIPLNPTCFDAADWLLMQQHSEIGERILLATEMEGAQQASLVIRQHHEFFNGQGYPDGLDGEEISLLARIISIADGYDAMAETRACHLARGRDEIMTIMYGETGNKYDPRLMGVFDVLIAHSKSSLAPHDSCIMGESL
jgi:HD-GYP domain-containing protein (c-di-GMP phosphodiesterase class II)